MKLDRYEHGSSAAHKQLCSDVLFAIGSGHDCRAWPNETGAYPVFKRDARGRIVTHANGEPVVLRWVAYGRKGSGDIASILCTGMTAYWECKTGKAVQQENQKDFEVMIKKFNGYYFTVYSVAEAVEYLKQALAHSRSRLK